MNFIRLMPVANPAAWVCRRHANLWYLIAALQKQRPVQAERFDSFLLSLAVYHSTLALSMELPHQLMPAPRSSGMDGLGLHSPSARGKWNLRLALWCYMVVGLRRWLLVERAE